MADVLVLDQQDDDSGELHQRSQVENVLDSSAGPEEVVSRIEGLVTEYLSSLASGQLLPLQLMPMPNVNRRAVGGDGSAVS